MKSIYIVLLILAVYVLSIDGFLLQKNNATSTKEKTTKAPKKGNLEF
jgi:hypothetical protein